MSGIFGWSPNRLSQAQTESTLSRMSAELRLNERHITQCSRFEEGAAGAVGLPEELLVWSRDGVTLAFQGRVRWGSAQSPLMDAQGGLGERLLSHYLQEGAGFLGRIFGNFCLAIIDVAQGHTLLAIDKLGLNSLNCCLVDGQLLFASNARAILRHPEGDPAIDLQSLYDYFYFHMVPAPRSIFAQQEKLLPGEYLQFEQGRVSKHFYWQPSYQISATQAESQLAETFRHLLKESVARASECSTAGAFLSGGTDSSSVTGLLRKTAGKPVDTFSIGFQAEGFDETEYARIAASHFDTVPHEYFLTPQDVVDAIPKIARAYDEPFGNASAVPAFYCAKIAAQSGLDALLAGDGGDELFAGNARYAKQKVFEAYFLIPDILRRKLIEPLITHFPGGDAITPVAKARSYIEQANVPLPDRMESYNFLNRIDPASIFSAEFLAQVDRHEPLALLQQTYRRAPTGSALNRMLYVDLKFTLADNDLRKVNRMCELAQMEVRYPMLDEALVEFSGTVPPALKLRGLQLRYFFKRALQNFLPPEILKKSKHGFGLPFGLWMNSYEPLRDIAHDNLNALALRGIVRQEFIRELISLHHEHPSYYGVMIWVLMMLEQWYQSLAQDR